VAQLPAFCTGQRSSIEQDQSASVAATSLRLFPTDIYSFAFPIQKPCRPVTVVFLAVVATVVSSNDRSWAILSAVLLSSQRSRPDI
jgi:hypothetical protein